MTYQIRVSGKLFQGADPKMLIKRAIEARKDRRTVECPQGLTLGEVHSKEVSQPRAPGRPIL